MFDSSVIKRMGQLWKFIVYVSGCGVGGIAMAIGYSALNNPDSCVFPVGMLSGIALVAACTGFAWVSIRCPACGQRWFWEAVRKQPLGRWLNWLLSLHDCPACGHPRKELASRNA